MKAVKYAKGLIVLNIIILLIRLFGEVRIYNIDAFLRFGVDYYIFSGTFSALAIVLVLPRTIYLVKRNLMTGEHVRFIYALVLLSVVSLLWAIIFSLRMSDPLGLYTIYMWNYYIVEVISSIYLWRIVLVIRNTR